MREMKRNPNVWEQWTHTMDHHESEQQVLDKLQRDREKISSDSEVDQIRSLQHLLFGK